MSGDSDPVDLEGISQEDLPILGENIAVDLANSNYGQGSGALDLLGPVWLASLWARQMAVVHEIPFERDSSKAGSLSINASMHRRFVLLRDSVGHVMNASMGKGIPRDDVIGVINAEAASSKIHTTFTWDSAGPQVEVIHQGQPFNVLCGRVALATIELVVGSDGHKLRQCAGEGCTLLFVQHHGRRRFCHDSCGHRERQMRYRTSKGTRSKR